jgi:TPR repeat protein
VAKDHNRAFEFASVGAALGCAHSKGALGRCIVYRDPAKGLALGRESAAAGSCFGQFVVGECYKYGYGVVAKDYAEAARLYRLAADQGHVEAQNSLGLMFEDGEGVAEDAAEAARLYLLAAEQGLAVAQLNIGSAFASGLGVTTDKQCASRPMVVPRRCTGRSQYFSNKR